MELWTELPAWLRFSISLALIGAAVALFMFADPVPLGLIGTLLGLGTILMLLGPSHSDKSGYKF